MCLRALKKKKRWEEAVPADAAPAVARGDTRVEPRAVHRASQHELTDADSDADSRSDSAAAADSAAAKAEE